MAGITQARYTRLLAHGQFVRSLHYHETPASRAGLYAAQLAYVAARYQPLCDADLRARLTAPPRDSGLWIGVFDGYRTNADVLAPLLDQYGLKAHFLLVTDFLDGSGKPQDAEIHRLAMESTRAYADRRYAMTWQEAALLARKHEIINHTVTHCRTGDATAALAEARRAQERIRTMLHLEPGAIAFLGGERISGCSPLHQGLQSLGLEYAVGIELEFMSAPEAAAPDLPPLPHGTGAARMLARYRQCQARHHFTDGVPSILPMAQARPYVTGDTMALAARFACISTLAMQDGETERDACLTALAALALDGMGPDFPLLEQHHTERIDNL